MQQPSPDGAAACSLARSPCEGMFCFLEENTELGMFLHCLGVWRVGRVCSDVVTSWVSLRMGHLGFGWEFRIGVGSDAVRDDLFQTGSSG